MMKLSRNGAFTSPKANVIGISYVLNFFLYMNDMTILHLRYEHKLIEMFWFQFANGSFIFVCASVPLPYSN